MSSDLFGGISDRRKIAVGTEFSVCKTGMHRLNMTIFISSLSLQRELILQNTKQQCFVEFVVCFGCTPTQIPPLCG